MRAPRGSMCRNDAVDHFGHHYGRAAEHAAVGFDEHWLRNWQPQCVHALQYRELVRHACTGNAEWEIKTQDQTLRQDVVRHDGKEHASFDADRVSRFETGAR